MPPVRAADVRRSARVAAKPPRVYSLSRDRSKEVYKRKAMHGIGHLRLSAYHVRQVIDGLNAVGRLGGWDLEKYLKKLYADDPVKQGAVLDEYYEIICDLRDLASHPIRDEINLANLHNRVYPAADALEKAVKDA